MNWQENKLTIIGFGIIFVILGVFGYLLWDMNREPMAEVSVTEPAPAKTDPKVIDPEPVKEKELPDYPITKVDTTGWEYRETKLGDVGIRYKSPSFNNNLIKYGLTKESYLFSWDEKSKQDLESDYLLSINPFGKSGTGVSYWIQPIKISFVESSSLSNQNIYDVFAKQTCTYDVVEVPENERYYDQKYKVVPKSECNTKEQVVGSVYQPITDINQESTRTRQIKRVDEVVSLCSSDSEIIEYKNPFIDKNNTLSSSLIKCKVVSGADNNKNIRSNDRELFILSLSNNKYAVIEYQNTGIVGNNGVDSLKTQAANNLMHTILSTIEVL